MIVPTTEPMMPVVRGKFSGETQEIDRFDLHELSR